MKKATKLLAWVLAASFALSLMSAPALASNAATGDEKIALSELWEESEIGIHAQAAGSGIHGQKAFVWYEDYEGKLALYFYYYFTNVGANEAYNTWEIKDSNGEVIASRGDEYTVDADTAPAMYFTRLADCNSKLIAGEEYTFLLRSLFKGSDGWINTVWTWDFVHDPSIQDIPAKDFGWGLNKGHLGYDAAAKSEYDITYEIRIQETIKGLEGDYNRYVYSDTFVVEAGSGAFIPYSGTWKSKDDKSTRYYVRVYATVDFDGVQRATSWDFTTNFLPVYLGLE